MGARILIVDDSPTIRKVVASILERHDYETVGASDGVHAMQVLATEERKPDLMLVDFVMPRMNGYQLCMSVRERPEYADVPVVLMSAKGDRIRGKFVQQTASSSIRASASSGSVSWTWKWQRRRTSMVTRAGSSR